MDDRTRLAARIYANSPWSMGILEECFRMADAFLAYAATQRPAPVVRSEVACEHLWETSTGNPRCVKCGAKEEPAKPCEHKNVEPKREFKEDDRTTKFNEKPPKPKAVEELKQCTTFTDNPVLRRDGKEALTKIAALDTKEAAGGKY